MRGQPELLRRQLEIMSRANKQDDRMVVFSACLAQDLASARFGVVSIGRN
jgi:hypothetical protein